MIKLIESIKIKASEHRQLFKEAKKGSRSLYSSPEVVMDECFIGYISCDVGCLGHWEAEILGSFEGLEELDQLLTKLIYDVKFELLKKEEQ